MTDELFFEPAVALAGRIARGEVSASEVTTAFLERIEQRNGLTNAFATVAAEVALDAARRCDAHQREGLPLGPLHGCRWRSRICSI